MRAELSDLWTTVVADFAAGRGLTVHWPNTDFDPAKERGLTEYLRPQIFGAPPNVLHVAGGESARFWIAQLSVILRHDHVSGVALAEEVLDAFGAAMPVDRTLVGPDNTFAVTRPLDAPGEVLLPNGWVSFPGALQLHAVTS